jgi:hypothetical protein
VFDMHRVGGQHGESLAESLAALSGCSRYAFCETLRRG